MNPSQLFLIDHSKNGSVDHKRSYCVILGFNRVDKELEEDL